MIEFFAVLLMQGFFSLSLTLLASVVPGIRACLISCLNVSYAASDTFDRPLFEHKFQSSGRYWRPAVSEIFEDSRNQKEKSSQTRSGQWKAFPHTDLLHRSSSLRKRIYHAGKMQYQFRGEQGPFPIGNIWPRSYSMVEFLPLLVSYITIRAYSIDSTSVKP